MSLSFPCSTGFPAAIVVILCFTHPAAGQPSSNDKPATEPTEGKRNEDDQTTRSLEFGLDRFDRQDKNNDGKLSKDEATIGLFPQLVDRFDANKDGFLGKDEFAAAVKEGRIRFGAGTKKDAQPRPNVAQMIPRIFEINDADQDGKITPEEAKPLVKSNFQKFDQNGDGVVDRKEFQAVAADMIRRRRPRLPRASSKKRLAELANRYWPNRPRASWKDEKHVLPSEDLSGSGVWIDPALDTLPATMLPVTVWFDRQFLGDGTAYSRRCDELSTVPRRTLRAKMVETLKHLSQQSFEAAEERMRQLVEDEKIYLIEWHWIVNGCSCLVTKDGLNELRSVPGVKKIFFARGRMPSLASDGPKPAFHGPQEVANFDPDRFKHPWYARYLQADKTWKRLGVNGKGALNVVMDGNFFFSPNVLANVYRNKSEVPGNGKDDDGNGLIDDYHGFNFVRGDALLAARSPDAIRSTADIHGFLCTAIICGAGTEDSPYEFGLAPKASWAGVVAGSRIEPAIEWAISQKADTLSMSFSAPGLQEYRSHWRKVMEQASLCGLCCVSGAGNFAREGTRSYAPVPVQLRTPEDIPDAVFAPAGVQRNLERTNFSSQGPVEWATEHYRDGLVQKPDFCAFNMGLPSLMPDGSVKPAAVSGNSFAGPMMAGTLALMVSADPDLLPWDAREILVATATDVGPSGIDHETGHGLINCYRAVREVLRRKCVREGGDPTPYEGREADDTLDTTVVQAAKVQVVQRVVPDSVTSKCGIRVGDLVETVNGRSLDSIDTVRTAVKKALQNETPHIGFVVRRDGKRVEIEVPTPKDGTLGIALTERYEEPVFK